MDVTQKFDSDHLFLVGLHILELDLFYGFHLVWSISDGLKLVFSLACTFI